MFDGIRQLKFPTEFRIQQEPWPEDLSEALEELSRATQSLKSTDDGGSDSAPAMDTALLANVGTGLWRIRQKMVQPGTDQPLEEMRRAYRHLESVWDALTQAGLQIQDHTGSPFDSGMSLNVLAFQATQGITRESVIETIKPTIYLNDRSIQMGEVIVGKPEA